jgi:hypothetical protein
MTAAIRNILARAIDALTDPARRNSAMAVFLAAYTALWTVYGVLAKSSQDLHADMTEIVEWSIELTFGYYKHPPLGPYITRAWFTFFPDKDWAFYLLAILVASVTLWIAWRIALRYLDARKALAATLLLTVVPFFNFHALKFNANTVLLPAWAATIWWFLISYETRSRLYAVLAGVAAAASMLGKYWSIFLLLGLGLAALIDRRRGDYFRSSAPYLTIAAGALVMAPHVVWLFQHDFAPMRYAATVHAAKPVGEALMSSLGYLGGALGYAVPAILLVALLFRPSVEAAKDTWLPRTQERRLVMLVFLLPFVLPALLAPLGGTTLNSLWSMSALTLLGLVLMSSPLVEVTGRALMQLLVIAFAFPVVMIAAAPGIAWLAHRSGLPPWQQHPSLIAPHVDEMWKQATNEPMRLICGDAGLAYGVAFYSPARPRSCEDIGAFPQLQRDERIARKGIVIVCFDNPACKAAVGRLSEGVTGSRQSVLEVSRSFMGSEGPRERYLIAVVPPQK